MARIVRIFWTLCACVLIRPNFCLNDQKYGKSKKFFFILYRVNYLSVKKKRMKERNKKKLIL